MGRKEHDSFLGQLGQESVEAETLFRIQPRCRLIHDDEARIAREGLSDSKALAHPAGIPLHGALGREREIHALEQIAHELLHSSGRLNALEREKMGEHRFPTQMWIESELLRQIAEPRPEVLGVLQDVRTVQRDRAGRGLEQPCENLHVRGFAGAVRTEQPEHSGWDVEIDPVQRRDRTRVDLDETARDEHGTLLATRTRGRSAGFRRGGKWALRNPYRTSTRVERTSGIAGRDLPCAPLETGLGSGSYSFHRTVQEVQDLRIGTPLSPGATKVMLLGAGELGKEVLIALQRLGVEVIAVDRYPHAPGHHVAHRFHVIDMTDPKALRALVDAEKPHLIVPEIEAIATDELKRIEEAGLATVIPTARATQLTMNREGIRRLVAEELQLPTSKYAFAESAEEGRRAADELRYPCAGKPGMSSSGQ